MSLYRIGDLWQNKGYVDIPSGFRHILWNALSLPIPLPTEPQSDVVTLYREKILRWNDSPRSHIKEECIDDLSVLRIQAVRQSMTVSNIQFASEDGTHALVSGCKSVWRWAYYDFAFTIFWALSYHLSQEELAHLFFCWDELHRLAREAYPNLREGTPDWRAFHLALYERVMGLSYDADRRVDCYKQNIIKRPGMQEETLKKRKLFFDGYIEFFKMKIEEELMK